MRVVCIVLVPFCLKNERGRVKPSHVLRGCLKKISRKLYLFPISLCNFLKRLLLGFLQIDWVFYCHLSSPLSRELWLKVEVLLKMWVWLRRCFMTFHGRSEEATLLSSWIWLRLMTGFHWNFSFIFIQIFFWMWMRSMFKNCWFFVMLNGVGVVGGYFQSSLGLRQGTGAFSLYSCRRSTQQRLVLSYLCSKRLSSLFTLLEAALSSRFICWWYNHLYQWQCSVA